MPVTAPAHVALTRVLAALGDPVRLAIVRTLHERDGVACNALGLDIPAPTLSHHLKVLREAGIVRSTPSGTLRLYALQHDELERAYPGLLAAVLR